MIKYRENSKYTPTLWGNPRFTNIKFEIPNIPFIPIKKFQPHASHISVGSLIYSVHPLQWVTNYLPSQLTRYMIPFRDSKSRVKRMLSPASSSSTPSNRIRVVIPSHAKPITVTGDFMRPPLKIQSASVSESFQKIMIASPWIMYHTPMPQRRTQRCTRCSEVGHSRRTCKEPLTL